MRILMVAAENDGIEHCKVGGIGDVVRDTPRALAAMGVETVVATPSHGRLRSKTKIWQSPFLIADAPIEVFEMPARRPDARIRHLSIHHPSLASPGGKIYYDDPKDRPFSSDASKFASFSRAVALAIQAGVFGKVDCLHLHDWHTAFLLILRKYHPVFRPLQSIRAAYTIHNLSLQGVRPFLGEESSLRSWYLDLDFSWAHLHSNREVLGDLADPRWPHCVNPMAAGIRLADAVHAVSPSYAEEILQPSDPANGFFGGEGLEGALMDARPRLFGILNGCDYPEARVGPTMDRAELFNLFRDQAAQWLSPHLLAYHRLTETKPAKLAPKVLLTTVTRVVAQKLRLLREPTSSGQPALEAILSFLGKRGLYVLEGTGAPEYEAFLSSMSARHPNFVFLNGYSEEVGSALYANGDIFIMPSSFEPCGISQMLALRDGQPCVVHSVGGLRDTIQDGVNGFAFTGRTSREQADNFVAACKKAIELKLDRPEEWKTIQDKARASRFLWKDSVEQYLAKLYGMPPVAPEVKAEMVKPKASPPAVAADVSRL